MRRPVPRLRASQHLSVVLDHRPPNTGQPTLTGGPIHSRKWHEFRKRVFAMYGRICWLCGHDGANEVDHVLPKRIAPGLFWELSNLRPAHGTSCPCPIGCGACNQARRRNPVPARGGTPQQKRKRYCDEAGCHHDFPHRHVSRPW